MARTPNGGTGVLATLTMGADHYCVAFGGAAGGTVTQDTISGFTVKNPTAEGPCP